MLDRTDFACSPISPNMQFEKCNDAFLENWPPGIHYFYIYFVLKLRWWRFYTIFQVGLRKTFAIIRNALIIPNLYFVSGAAVCCTFRC